MIVLQFGSTFSSIRARSPCAGFTTIELLVSLVLSLLVVSALSQAMLAALRSGRHAEALAQVTDDAGAALAAMRQDIALAGFSAPRAASAPDAAASGNLAAHAFPAVLGCAGASFRDPSASILAPPACNPTSADPAASDALEVAHEATVMPGATSNAVLGGPDGAAPLDCLGNSFPRTPATEAGASDWWLADSKFYVAAGSLFCHGPGNAAGAALAQNVEALHVAYGMAVAPPGETGAGQVVYFAAAPPIGAPEWADVVAIRLCVQVRSAAPAVDAAATLGAWIDCANVRRTSTDGVLRRSFTTTVTLSNRVAS